VIDLSQLEALKDIPQNIVISIFLAGFAAGFLVTIILLLMMKAGGNARMRSSQTQHDVIMAIKRRAGEGRPPMSFFGFIKFILAVMLLLLGFLTLVAIGRYLTEGQSRGEAFIPFVLRIFVLPMAEQYPILQKLF
jgi:hypothetical protein